MATCVIEIPDSVLEETFTRIGNQIFKLLPLREEGGAWAKLLDSLVTELTGLCEMFPRDDILLLLDKLRGIYSTRLTMDFMEYRRNIFECCSLAGQIRGRYSNVNADDVVKDEV